MSVSNQPKPIENTRDLRRFLVGQMEGVATGKVNTERAKAICNLSQQVYNSLNLEVKMAIARSKLKDGQSVEPVGFDD
jgi:hypothetical protein